VLQLRILDENISSVLKTYQRSYLLTHCTCIEMITNCSKTGIYFFIEIVKGQKCLIVVLVFNSKIEFL